MDIVELIGFLISFFAFVFLMFRRVMRNRTTEEEEEEVEQNKKLKDFLKSLDIEIEEEKEEKKPVRLPPPPKPVKPLPHKGFETYRFDSHMDSYKQQSAVETRKLQTKLQASLDEKGSKYKEAVNEYHMIQKAKPSRARQIMTALKSPKEMIVLGEILRRPYR